MDEAPARQFLYLPKSDKAAWRAQRAHVTVPISTLRVVARAARSVQKEPIRIHKTIVKQRHDVCTASLPRTLATFVKQQGLPLT
jgi:hypothetical protein